MHRHMLLCCGAMTVIFGALIISSVAVTVGLTTGQTHLTIAGFVIAAAPSSRISIENIHPPRANHPTHSTMWNGSRNGRHSEISNVLPLSATGLRECAHIQG